MSARKEKWEKAFGGGQLDSVRKETPVLLNHGSHSGQRAQSPSSTSEAPTRTDGRSRMYSALHEE